MWKYEINVFNYARDQRVEYNNGYVNCGHIFHILPTEKI